MGREQRWHLIDALAAGQHGVVTRRQLLEAGLSAGAIWRLLRNGRLRALHQGVYLVGPVQSPRARPLAAVLAGGRGALVSHATAAWLWEVWPPCDGEPIDVTPRGGGAGGRRPQAGIRFHHTVPVPSAERTELDRIPVTAPGRTLVDLAGFAEARKLEQAVAKADRQGLVTLPELDALAERYRLRPGVAALRAILASEAGPVFTQSELEERLLALIPEAGLPLPRFNVRIGPYEVDAFWPDEAVAVEADGYRYHGGRARFEGDRRKDAYLTRRGIHVIRLSWKQIVERPTNTAVLITTVLLSRGGGLQEEERPRVGPRIRTDGQAG
jgi:very-short-patch-repair endonuclease